MKAEARASLEQTAELQRMREELGEKPTLLPNLSDALLGGR
jgi:hypothetical protein